jgi:hypothetical protein
MTYTQTSSLSSVPNAPDKVQILSLYFDGSKSKEGAHAGCVLIDLTGNNSSIT